MSTDPCMSNDAILFTNDSNDSISFGIKRERNPEDLGCGDLSTNAPAQETTEAKELEEVEVADVEPENETETEPDEAAPASAAELAALEEAEAVEPEKETEIEPEEAAPASAAEPATFLSCNSATALEMTDRNAEKVDLAYDYEIRTTGDADLMASVKAFEFDLLKAVAKKYDLSSCEFGRRSLRNGRELTGTTTSSLVGVGSYPDDVEDSFYTECDVNDDSSISPNCTPINGGMTAWMYDTGRRRLSKDDLYTAIQAYSESYTNERVLSVSYIGTRAAVPFIDKATRDDGDTDNLVPNSKSMTPGAIAGIAMGSALALLALLALVVRKRRNGKNAAKKEEPGSIVDDALFMADDGEELKQVKDDASDKSVNTEDHTYYDDTLPSSGTFESEGRSVDEEGFEIRI